MTFRVACVPPTTSHHAKRIVLRPGQRGFRARLVDSPGLTAARQTLAALLLPFRPQAPISGPVVLGVIFEWPWTTQHPARVRAAGRLPKTSKPDLSNVIKTLEDVLVALQFLEDDRAVAVLHVEKWWSDRPGITITLTPLTPTVEATPDDPIDSFVSPAPSAAEFRGPYRRRSDHHRHRPDDRPDLRHQPD